LADADTSWKKSADAKNIKHFVGNIHTRTVPGKKECEAAQSQFPLLSCREWRHIKFAVKNIISAEKKLAM